MDIAALSIAMNESAVKQAASLATMKIAMDSATGNAAGLVEMLQKSKAMEQSVQPHLGGTIDVRL